MLPTSVDTSAPEFRENAAQMDQVMSRLHELHMKISRGGPAKATDKHVARGKMLVRE